MAPGEAKFEIAISCTAIQKLPAHFHPLSTKSRIEVHRVYGSSVDGNTEPKTRVLYSESRDKGNDDFRTVVHKIGHRTDAISTYMFVGLLCKSVAKKSVNRGGSYRDAHPYAHVSRSLDASFTRKRYDLLGKDIKFDSMESFESFRLIRSSTV